MLKRKKSSFLSISCMSFLYIAQTQKISNVSMEVWVNLTTKVKFNTSFYPATHDRKHNLSPMTQNGCWNFCVSLCFVNSLFRMNFEM